jgi:hypothetical protein
MLTLNQRKLVIEHLDKARLILLNADQEYKYDKLEIRISNILEDILKLRLRED